MFSYDCLNMIFFAFKVVYFPEKCIAGRGYDILVPTESVM